jgi:hypothetical protein
MIMMMVGFEKSTNELFNSGVKNSSVSIFFTYFCSSSLTYQPVPYNFPQVTQFPNTQWNKKPSIHNDDNLEKKTSSIPRKRDVIFIDETPAE